MSERRPEPRGYFGTIAVAARSVSEGMAVTLAQYFRRPTTVQYPDRTRVPVVESLPERYRGFLEVDMAICTACKACERDCPIDVIAIDVEKRGDERVMTRFDIDMGKCMYCGICVESCPIPAQAPGDAEPTKCIRMTREFEGATSHFSSLTFRFVPPDAPAPAYKFAKGSVPATPERGRIARQVRQHASTHPLPPRAVKLAAKVAATQDFAALVVEEALAKTDCGACGWPTCRAYADAIADGREPALDKCEPGGANSARDVALLVRLRTHR